MPELNKRSDYTIVVYAEPNLPCHKFQKGLKVYCGSFVVKWMECADPQQPYFLSDLIRIIEMDDMILDKYQKLGNFEPNLSVSDFLICDNVIELTIQ